MKKIANNTEFWKNEYNHKYNTGFSEQRSLFISELMYKNKDKISSVLELGCSSGVNLLQINKRCPDIELFGIDVSKEAIEYGKLIEKNPANLMCFDLLDSKWEECFVDKKFDLVFTSGVLCYLSTDAVIKIISSMSRLSNKFILHIERWGKNKTIKTTKNNTGVVYMNGYRFNLLYEKLGIKIENIKDLREIGGDWARSNFCIHLILANLTQEKFII